MKYIPVGIVSLLLLAASLIDLPYGFYTFLRFVVCGFSVYCIVVLVDIYKKKIGYYFIPICVALLFNPLFPVHLDRDTWAIIDLIAIPLIWFPYLLKEFRNRN